jgi:hypothetical protein
MRLHSKLTLLIASTLLLITFFCFADNTTYRATNLGFVKKGAIVEVDVRGDVRVFLVDTQNYLAYTKGRPTVVYGGPIEVTSSMSPVFLIVPESDTWWVIVDNKTQPLKFVPLVKVHKR